MRGPSSCTVGCVSWIHLSDGLRPERAMASHEPRSSSSEAIAEPLEESPLPRDLKRGRHRTPVRNFAVTLRPCVSHLLRRWWSDRVRRKQLRHCVPRCGRRVGDQCRRSDAGLARDLWRNGQRGARIKNDALRPFPIGVNADDGRDVLRAFCDLRCRKIGAGNEQQRKQPCADKEKIPCQGHLGSFIPARI